MSNQVDAWVAFWAKQSEGQWDFINDLKICPSSYETNLLMLECILLSIPPD
jgi:hypothetical protein